MSRNHARGLVGATAYFVTILIMVSIVVTFLAGVVKAFSASVAVGICSIFLPPAFMLYGILGLFGVDLPQKIATALGL